MRTIRETKSERWFQNLVDQEFMKFGRRLINAEEKWPEPSDAVNCYSYNSEQVKELIPNIQTMKLVTEVIFARFRKFGSF